MEDDLKKNKNGKQPQKMKWKTTSKESREKRKTNSKKSLFSIPLKFRGKPFLVHTKIT
jgi:hypothetical protein